MLNYQRVGSRKTMTTVNWIRLRFDLSALRIAKNNMSIFGIHLEPLNGMKTKDRMGIE
jgi:hypothetical protein